MALTYFTEFVITSNGSHPAPMKTRWVPLKDSTSGSPELWWAKKHYYITWHCTKSNKWYLYMVALVTTLQANLQLIISIPLKNSTEWALQEEDSVHHRSFEFQLILWHPTHQHTESLFGIPAYFISGQWQCSPALSALEVAPAISNVEQAVEDQCKVMKHPMRYIYDSHKK